MKNTQDPSMGRTVYLPTCNWFIFKVNLRIGKIYQTCPNGMGGWGTR